MASFLLQENGGKIELESGDGFLLLDYVVKSVTIGSTITSETKTIPSYLYFQYINDENLPSLINAYNTMTQANIDWFNNLNLPIYTLLSGNLLDWVGAGLYGLPRPVFSSDNIIIRSGPTDTIAITGSSDVDTLATAQLGATSTSTTTYIPDGIYKNILTWFFYKNDTRTFSIPWLKRRIARFLYSPDGSIPDFAYTQSIGIVFNYNSTIGKTVCTISLSDTPATNTDYFIKFIDSGQSGLPFRFDYEVVIV